MNDKTRPAQSPHLEDVALSLINGANPGGEFLVNVDDQRGIVDQVHIDIGLANQLSTDVITISACVAQLPGRPGKTRIELSNSDLKFSIRELDGKYVVSFEVEIATVDNVAPVKTWAGSAPRTVFH